MVKIYYLQADIVVKVNSIVMEAKGFIVSHGTTKAQTSKSAADDNVVFNLMRQIVSATRRMDLSKVYCMIYEMRIQFNFLLNIH